MAGRSSQADNRGANLFGLLVSGKGKEFHTFRSGPNSGGGASGLSATGGVISDYADGPIVYRAHIFTSSGALTVTELGDLPAEADYVIVGGGGAGGFDRGGGGGAGAFVPGTLTLGVAPYPVVIGAGGAGAGAASVQGGDGGTTQFGPITVKGGGGGGSNDTGMRTGRDSSDPYGGSGGGGAQGLTPPYDGGSSGTYGNDGGTNPTTYWGAGGGGAGGTARDPSARAGGLGVQNGITGITTTYAGGGGAGGDAPGFPGGPDDGSGGGGGNGGAPYPTPPSGNGEFGTFATGSGGGGGSGNAPQRTGGGGGSGVVVVRYQIGSTSVAKASGGSVSFYNGKTIHTFTKSGNFVAPATFNETVEYVVVGGGGAGGGPSLPSGGNAYYGGGGGAGAYIKGSTPISTPQTIAVQIGAGGAKHDLFSEAGSPTYFGTPITAPGGGYGATWQDPGGQPQVGGGPGGSSGGSSYGGSVQPSTGAAFSPTDASADTPANGWGHPGGTGNPGGNNGGGGGAGGAGQNADASNGGDGGAGMQLPTTFRDPASTVGAPGPTNTSTHNPGWTNIDDSGKYWLAGGGGGSSYGPNSTYTPGGGGTNTHGPGSFAGAGEGSRFIGGGTAALANTGSGGGGSERSPSVPDFNPNAGQGGSGIVLIAYPT